MSIENRQFVEIFIFSPYNKIMKNLKSLRKTANLTLLQFSAQIGISSQVLSRYEREEREADYKTLAKIAKFFDVSIDYLLGESDFYYPDKAKIIANKKSPAPTLSQAEQDLLKDFRSVPRSEQAQIAEYAHYVADKHAVYTSDKRNA